MKTLSKKLNAEDPEEFEFFNIQVEKFFEYYEFQIFIELFTEFFTFFPAEQVRKPVPQHFMEPVTFQLFFGIYSVSVFPFVSNHLHRHRVIERIGFRLPFASCWFSFI